VPARHVAAEDVVTASCPSSAVYRGATSARRHAPSRLRPSGSRQAGQLPPL